MDEDGKILTVATHRNGAVVTVEIEGELDLAGTDTLSRKVSGAVAEGDTTAVEVDTSRLRFVDSSGLATLLTLSAELASSGIVLRVTAASDHFLRVVKLAGLGDVLFPTD